jgi:hypothetical protein
MVNNLAEIVVNLRQARHEAALRVAEAQADLQKIDEALERLEGNVEISPTSFRPKDMTNLGIIEAARRLLQELGREATTREIADAIRDRGVETKSKNFVPTVYATLTNSREFARKGDKWVLKKAPQQSA